MQYLVLPFILGSNNPNIQPSIYIIELRMEVAKHAFMISLKLHQFRE